jgi:enamine deaminase RidA (YjgF/YER057c/UK114 family)
MWNDLLNFCLFLIENRRRDGMGINTRRKFFSKIAALAAFVTGAKLFAQQAGAVDSSATAPAAQNADKNAPRHSNAEHHVYEGIYYFSGTGANDGYPKEDHVLVTDPFEKHVTRTMDALKRSVERAGSDMDNILHLQVFLCLPLAEGVVTPTGKARFDAHKAQYDAPSRACMALEWIPGDSLIEIVGSAKVVHAPAPVNT